MKKNDMSLNFAIERKEYNSLGDGVKLYIRISNHIVTETIVDTKTTCRDIEITNNSDNNEKIKADKKADILKGLNITRGFFGSHGPDYELSNTFYDRNSNFEKSENILHTEKQNLEVSLEDYFELGKPFGKISQETYESLLNFAGKYTCVKRGLNMLSYGANNKKQIRDKLILKGHSRSDSESAAEYLYDKGLINEESQIERLIEVCVRKNWGEKRIRAYISQKGYSTQNREFINDILSRIDFLEVCENAIYKKFGQLGIPKEINERDKAIAYLMRQGFSYSEIKKSSKE